MASEAPTKFKGWVGLDKDSVNGNLVFQEFDVKPFGDDDVDVKISHCGVCASDLHTLRSGWGPSDYPVVVGHEIVGHVVRKGKNVTELEIGDRVGVGASCSSCLNCEECNTDNEPYCAEIVGTYNSKYPDGSKTRGGYAEYGRFPAAYAFKIPDALPSAVAAPMLCGGVTVFSPLKRYGAGPGKTVGIVGIGGLGHFGILFASTLGATNVVAISRTRAKEADARAMGATDFIATSEDGWSKKHPRKFDLIVCTANDADMPLGEYLMMMKPHGFFVQVGVPEEPLKSFNTFPLTMFNVHLTGTGIGSRKEIREMLELAATKNVKSWVIEKPMSEVNEVMILMEDGKARYRYVLVN